MNYERLIKLAREKFYAEIAVKSGWGNQELKLVWERSMGLALTELLAELEEKGV